MTTIAAVALTFALTFVLVVLATRAVLPVLIAQQIIDVPNERSSHTQPVPRGGGLGVMAGLVPVLIAVGWATEDARLVWYAPGLFLLLAISWRDDRASQPALLRLACHFAAVVTALIAFPASSPILHDVLPFWIDRVLAALIWVWFINLTNFLDGLDGMAGVEMGCIGGGAVAIALLAGAGDPTLTLVAAALAGAGGGFLVWNWHPARVFLGDVGSVPLGFIAGGVLLMLSAAGAWPAAIILPLYYLADATLTLLWRLARGEQLAKAHRHHWYQKAALAIGHRKTVAAILAGNAMLILLAIVSTSHPIASLAAAIAVVVALLGALSFAAGQKI